MGSRRHEDYAATSDSLARLRERRRELDGGPTYEMTRRDDDLDRSTRSRRCLSPDPHRQQFSGGGRINNSLEKRVYGREFIVSGNRHEQMTSMSPEFELVRRKPQGSEGDSRRNIQYTRTSDGYEYRGYRDENYDDNTGLRPEYLLDTTRTIREHFSHDSKSKGSGEYRKLSEELVSRPTNISPTYGDRCGYYIPSRESIEAGYRDDSVYYPEPLLQVDKSSDIKFHEERDKSVTYSRDASHFHVIQSKDNRGALPYKQLAGTSSTALRANSSGFYMDDLPSYEDEYFRDPVGPTSRRSSRQGYPLDQRDNPSSIRHEGRGYMNTGNMKDDEFDYPFDECRRVDSEDRVDIYQDNYGHLRSNTRENSAMKKQIESFYYTRVSEKGKEFADPRMSRYQELVPSDIIYDRECDVSPSWKSSQYRFGREMGPSSHGESMRSMNSDHNSKARELRSNYGHRTNAGFKYEHEIHTPLPMSSHQNLSDRRLKRKYVVDEPINRHNSSRDMIRSDEEWTDEGFEFQIPSQRLYYDESKPFQRNKRISDRLVEREHVAHDNHLQARSGVHSRLGTGSPGLYNSSQVSKKIKPYRPNVWLRDDSIANTVDDKPESWVTSKKPEPPEDSQEFQQLVHKAFLVFSKKLNENPSARKIYTEQGRAGSLFCIVCGQSASKEFMVTNRLASHAYMSHKVGLRSQHLGLLKALCVLMGWNSEAKPETDIYIPEPVSQTEALAQKEDLILWPPVIIIHTTSSSSSSFQAGNTNTVDDVSEFLKGKGLVGNYKVTLGQGGKNSSAVVVLKYLGTVSNLQNAEMIHKYFLDNKISRVDYKESKDVGGSSGGGYYGYMGICEDMDMVDNDTKVKCVIKSKKEIHDIVDAVPIHTSIGS
ncbi:uncharacterized protein LOC124926233 [Impatiens glandulifera]|uniref:uncharacterized protein LOC124926233 n=1 Tax=Impatiens glandulifera TaxID=253017 RepID=UPI001FB108E2|nr:uncharacterized protein LOC124926233 [Impatiens glandulifera]